MPYNTASYHFPIQHFAARRSEELTMVRNHATGVLKRLALAAVAVFGLGTAALPPAPASAQMVIGTGIPGILAALLQPAVLPQLLSALLPAVLPALLPAVLRPAGRLSRLPLRLALGRRALEPVGRLGAARMPQVVTG
jgi:hypothetical protein